MLYCLFCRGAWAHQRHNSCCELPSWKFEGGWRPPEVQEAQQHDLRRGITPHGWHWEERLQRWQEKGEQHLQRGKLASRIWDAKHMTVKVVFQSIWARDSGWLLLEVRYVINCWLFYEYLANRQYLPVWLIGGFNLNCYTHLWKQEADFCTLQMSNKKNMMNVCSKNLPLIKLRNPVHAWPPMWFHLISLQATTCFGKASFLKAQRKTKGNSNSSPPCTTYFPSHELDHSSHLIVVLLSKHHDACASDSVVWRLLCICSASHGL